MRKIIPILIFGMLLLSIVLVSADEGHESEIEEGRKLVESNISCGELSDEQLEAIGDYYMEQMHSGEAHELMHDMMGGHDSELTKEMHINMAKGIYCDENVGMMSCGMINNRMMGGNMMSGMMSGGMMDSGDMMDGNMMENMMNRQTPQTNMVQGMMGNFGYLGYQNSYWNFMNFFYMILLIGSVILVYSALWNLLRNKK